METGLWPYSQLGIYGPRQPLIVVPNIPNPKQGREWSLQVSLFLAIPFLTVLWVVPAMPFHGGKEVFLLLPFSTFGGLRLDQERRNC